MAVDPRGPYSPRAWGMPSSSDSYAVHLRANTQLNLTDIIAL